MSPPVVTTTNANIGELIHNICNTTENNATIIACCKKSYFFNQLQSYVFPQSGETNELHQESPDSNALHVSRLNEYTQSSYPPRSMQLLRPTISLLAKSLKTNLVFCSSIPAFRAFLPTLVVRPDVCGQNSHRIIILDMLALHHGTSEFTIQGLSRSFALLASVCHNLSCKTELVECTDIHDALSPHKGYRLWTTDVPLLSGSVKIGEAGQGWANRTINIKAFAERWFTFY